MLRHQLPAYSPLPLRAVFAGVTAALDGDDGTAAARLLQAQYGPRDVVLTESGTAALMLALRGALALRPGALVALPAYCCYDVLTAAVGANAPVVLYDVDPTTLGPDLASLEAALSSGAGAVVVAHLYGMPVDLAPITTLAAGAGAIVIEDAAQGAGASVRGRSVGTSGSLAVLSFGRGKGVTAGAGGALLAHDDVGVGVIAGAQRALGVAPRGWSLVGANFARWLFARPSLFALPAAVPFLHLGETVYLVPREPRRLSRCSAGALPVTWPYASSEVGQRRKRAERLVSCLRAGGAFAALRVAPGHQPGYLRLPLIAAPRARQAAMAPAARRLGIMPGYPASLADLPVCRTRCINAPADFVGARTLVTRLCTLPTHSRLSEPDCQALEAWLAGVERWAATQDERALIHDRGHTR